MGDKHTAKLRAEIERQCSIGAGTIKIDEGYLEATGLWMVNADLDPRGLARALTPAAQQFPHLYRTGAYLFFALCSFGISMLAYAAARAFGFNDSVTHFASSIAMIASFLALRDMTKRPATPTDTKPAGEGV